MSEADHSADLASRALSETKGIAEATRRELSSIPFLAVASARSLARLAETVQLVHAPRGKAVFEQGDLPAQLYVVRSGRVGISIVFPGGDEEERRSLGPGDLLGELGILGGHPRTATAVALEDSELWAIDREIFLDLYHAEPAVGIQVAAALAPYVLDNDLVAEDLLFLDLPGRVAKRLLAFADDPARRVHHVVPSESMTVEQVAAALKGVAQSRQEAQTMDHLYADVDNLAMLSGGTREAVIRLLVELERRGLLLNTEGNVMVINADGLARLARLEKGAASS